MKKHGTVYAVTEKLSLADFRLQKAALVKRYFSADELKVLHNRPDRNSAGIVAVKRALLGLCSELGARRRLSGKSFEIGHLENGAPVVYRSPEISISGVRVNPADLHVSISHNRTHACAVAVFATVISAGETRSSFPTR
jgi:holo-[acyl-carrier-protein] synthase